MEVGWAGGGGVPAGAPPQPAGFTPPDLLLSSRPERWRGAPLAGRWSCCWPACCRLPPRLADRCPNLRRRSCVRMQSAAVSNRPHPASTKVLLELCAVGYTATIRDFPGYSFCYLCVCVKCNIVFYTLLTNTSLKIPNTKAYEENVQII